MSEGTVLVQGKFSIYTQFLDRTFQVEVKMKEGESIRDAVLRVNKELEETAAELRKTVTPSPEFVPIAMGGTIDQPKVIDYKQIEELEKSIDNAQTKDELTSIKDACEKAGLVSQYIKRLNELNNDSTI